MRAVDLIRTKRDGGQLDRAAIEWFVHAVTAGALPDYQASALLMAIVLRGMTADETSILTDAMVRSGVRVEYPGISGVPVDKHSTGGVGDKTSIVLAPLAAACGALVPMMSGRGLGHTGGTLDKLESIPGFRTALSLDELRDAIGRVGCALIGQTSDIAPADRKLYALRDVTGTVESIPLISSSIMSKKIAEGIGGLVLDVKSGDGAFMKTHDDARRLAQSLVSIGESAGVRTEALLTSMDAPLGREVGNANEIAECIDTLKGHGPEDIESLSIELAARMLVVSGVERDAAEASVRVRRALTSRATTYTANEIELMKKLVGHDLASESRIPPSVATSAIATPSSRARAGATVSRCAAAAGVITSVRTRRTPTTWIASAVVSASSRKVATDSPRIGTPRASAPSGSTLAKSSGR